MSGRRSALSVWNGSEFELAVPQPTIPTGWVSEYGPVVQLERDALGDPLAFNVMFESRNGADRDRAPDTDSWPYEVRPLELTASKVNVGRARAGRPLRTSMNVLRSDFDVPLSDGAVRCGASLARTNIRGSGSARDGLIACTWRLPAWSRARPIRGTIAFTYQGVTASGSFTALIGG